MNWWWWWGGGAREAIYIRMANETQIRPNQVVVKLEGNRQRREVGKDGGLQQEIQN